MAEQKFPEPTVGAVIVNPKGEVFLMKSHKFRDKFVIPGGHIELGETMEEALKREIKEEVGIKIFGIEFLCLQEMVFDNAFWKKKHFIFIDFSAKTNSSKVKLNEEGTEPKWVSLKEAFSLPLEPYTRYSLEKFREKFYK